MRLNALFIITKGGVVDTVSTYREVGTLEKGFIDTYAPMVKRIAFHLKGRLPQSVMVEDLIQAGMIGLLEAAKKFDATKGARFETYAGIRIRGHMLDEVRRNDWVPRSVYRNSRTISDAIKKIENVTGRDAKDREVAKELGLPLDEYHDLLKDAVGGVLYGFDDVGVNDDLLTEANKSGNNEPFSAVEKDDFNRQLIEIIESLPEREKMVLSLYYEQELNLKEIGEVLGVTESRVSQIHSQTMMRVKARLAE